MKKIYALMLTLIVSMFASQKIYAQDPIPWDGAKTDVTINEATTKVIYELIATKAGNYTFFSDTKEVGPKIKVNDNFSKPIGSWQGATITLDGVTVGEKLTIEVTAAEEPGYPVTFPLELNIEIPDDTEYTPWDGVSGINIRIETAEDIKYYSYTHSGANVMFYLMSVPPKNTNFNVILKGTVNKDPFEATDYDNNNGAYARFKMFNGDVLKFSVQSTSISGVDEFSARVVPITGKAFPLFGQNQPGHGFENYIDAEYNKPMDIPVNDAPASTAEATGIESPNVTWLSFTPAASGIANFEADLYDIYVIREDQYGSTEVAPRHIIQDKANNNHLFTVEAGQKYLIAVPNPRPITATLKFTEVADGGDCQLPIEFTGSSKMDVKNGELWYKYNFADKEYLEITSNADWAGTIRIIKFCNDERPVTITKKAGEPLVYYSELEKDAYSTSLLIQIQGKTDISDAVVLTERDAKAGETCALSIPIQLGENSCGGAHRRFFYSYTSDDDAMIDLTLSSDSLMLIGTTCGVATVPISPENKVTFRATAGETYYIEVMGKTTTPGKITLAKKEISLGDYCDLPIVVDPAKEIKLGNIPVGSFKSKFFSFSETAAGVRTFSALDSAIIADKGWTLNIKTECEGENISVAKTMGADFGEPIYSFHVEAGQTYIAELVQYPSKNDFVFTSTFRDVQDGDNCGRPIAAVIGETKKLAYTKLATFFEVDMTEIGFYEISALLGPGSTLYRHSTCASEGVQINSPNAGWATGEKYEKIYISEPTKMILVSTIISDSTKVDYTLGIKFLGDAAAGELCSSAITATLDQIYPFASNSAEKWFKYTVQPNETVYFKNRGAYFGFEFFTACGGDPVTFKDEMILGDDKGTIYTPPTVNEATEYLIKVTPGTIKFNFQISADRATLTDKVTVAAAKIYPNPSNGVFTIMVPELADNAQAIVRNILGAQVATVVLNATETTVDLGSIATGNYIITVINGEKSSSHKLIIK